jgi:hypothetical protein
MINLPVSDKQQRIIIEKALIELLNNYMFLLIQISFSFECEAGLNTDWQFNEDYSLQRMWLIRI